MLKKNEDCCYKMLQMGRVPLCSLWGCAEIEQEK